MEKFSNWLTKRMKEVGFNTPAELARAANISDQTLSNYMNSKVKKPDLDKLIALSDALKVSLDTLARKAGFKQDFVNVLTEQLDEADLLFRSLPDDDREEILQLMRLKQDRNNRKKISDLKSPEKTQKTKSHYREGEAPPEVLKANI